MSNEAQVQEVSKKGDYYVVKGKVNGRETSVHIPSPSVESRTRKDAKALFERGLQRSAEQEK